MVTAPKPTTKPVTKKPAPGRRASKDKMYPPMLVKPDLAARIERVRKKLLSERPGENLSRANVIRMLLAAGCDKVES